MQLRINVIQFWASIVPMISMIKWQCYTCYYYHYSYYHHFLLSLISWCAVLTNTPGLRDSVVMRVLSDFYWTAATGAGLFYVKQRNATASCWALCAGSTCTLLRTSFVDRNTHSGKAYEGTCRIPRQNGDGRGRRLGKKKDSHSVCRGLYMKCAIWEDTWGH